MLKGCCARFWQQLSSKQQAAAGSKAAILQAGEPFQRHEESIWAGELQLSVCSCWALASQATAAGSSSSSIRPAASNCCTMLFFEGVTPSNCSVGSQVRRCHAMNVQGVHS
jgi:hypothetical protein